MAEQLTRDHVVALLGKEAILAAVDLPTRDVEVPEWGGVVRIRSMNSVDRDDFEMATMQAREEGRLLPGNVRAIMASRCIVDAEGKQLFSLDEAQQLGEKSGAALKRVWDAILELNAIEPGAIEDAAKNSSSAPEGASSSGSPSPSDAPSGKSKV